MQDTIVFLLREKYCRKESSRSLSHLLVSFLYQTAEYSTAHSNDKYTKQVAVCCNLWHYVTTTVTVTSLKPVAFLSVLTDLLKTIK